MAIQTLHDTGSSFQITPKMDGGVYATAITDCVCKGIGDQFTLNYANNSLDVSFEAGSQAVIGGAFFRVTTLTAVTLTANSTIYLCANINLSNSPGSTGSFVQRASSSSVKKQNLNGVGTQRDLLLYVVKTNANGVTSVQDKRYIVGNGSAAIADLNMDNLQIISDLPNMSASNFQALNSASNVTSASLETIASNAIPTVVIPSSDYTGSGKKVVFSSNSPATIYDGYIYVNSENQGAIAQSAVPVRTALPTSDWGGNGKRIIYSTTAPTTTYNNYIYINPSYQNLLARGALPILTTAPTANNTNGVKIVYLASAPSTFYSGYIYLIKES